MKLSTRIFDKNQNIAILAGGGVGKSFILQKIYNLAKKNGKQVYLTSTSGTSANNIKGTTLHSFAGIQLGNKPIEEILKMIRFNKDCYNRWKNVEMLLIDEISMLSAETFELIEKIAREMKRNNFVFGGIQLIISGDFLQLPPVTGKYIFTSEIWDLLEFHTICPKTPHRYPDLVYYHMLKRIRIAEHTDEDIKILQTRIDAYKLYLNYSSNPREFYIQLFSKFIYSNDVVKLLLDYILFEHEIKPTRLYAKKVNVEDFNNKELNTLKGSTMIYNSTQKIKFKKGSGTSKQIEKYSTYMDDIIPKTIYLKEGAQVMLTKNLSVQDGLTNGSRGVVTYLGKDTVFVLFKSGEIIPIGSSEFIYEDDNVYVRRLQIPLILCFATSIHKSQGATLDYCVMNLGDSIFSPALSYVALSRVKTLSGVLLEDFNPNRIIAHHLALEFERKMMREKKDEKKEKEDSDD